MPTTPTRDTSDRSPRAWIACAFIGGAALAVAVAAASPASASGRAPASCDRLGGTTLAANSHLRLFRQRLTASELRREGYASGASGLRIRGCSYRTRRVSDLRWSIEYGQNAEPTTYTWAVEGAYAAVSTSESGTDDGTDRSAGISTETLVIWNARTRRTIRPYTRQAGLRFSELVVSPKGSVAAIGNPYRFGRIDENGAHRPLAQSYVITYEPGAQRNPGGGIFRPVASGPPDSLSGLAISRGTLLWTDRAGVGQAPIR